MVTRVTGSLDDRIEDMQDRIEENMAVESMPKTHIVAKGLDLLEEKHGGDQ